MNTENITVNTQSSIRIAGSKVLYFDPFRIEGEPHDADIIFITHAHYDHFDAESIRKVAKADTVIAAPVGMEKEIRAAAEDLERIFLSPGESMEISGVPAQAIPAYNKLKPFHPRKNKWIGYVAMLDGVRYYVAGDTDAVKELADLYCDVALVPIGGTYTMNAKEAAALINLIRPQVAIPTHYGDIVGKPDDAGVFEDLVDAGINVERKLSFS